ncbi:hypothetical protein [Chamaesiphon sp. OTE_8_metabat_110]|uniref:hypothetical protein n=1 Tax=Chamaesiphon sp. OTE_8_metabat_110 TaxID=2964696 RepID=UPI00286AF8BC|nr:hypothetical protein [Chamaesiphon sp. OTE_8_metabat_110]
MSTIVFRFRSLTVTYCKGKSQEDVRSVRVAIGKILTRSRLASQSGYALEPDLSPYLRIY